MLLTFSQYDYKIHKKYIYIIGFFCYIFNVEICEGSLQPQKGVCTKVQV